MTKTTQTPLNLETLQFSDIQKAQQQLQKHISITPILKMPDIPRLKEHNIFLKAENLQVTGSFKIRGAAYFLLKNQDKLSPQGVIAASAGNHAQGVAYMSQKLGISAEIVMPVKTPPIKAMNTEAMGAKVTFYGETVNESAEYAWEKAQKGQQTFVPPYAHKDIIAGQGTLGLELIDTIRSQKIETLLIPVGGGGIALGTAIAIKNTLPHISIIGVVADKSPMVKALFDRSHKKQDGPSLADGIAGINSHPQIVAELHKYLDQIVSVEEESISDAIEILCEKSKLIVEGGGAVGLAALLEGKISHKNVMTVLTGGNVDPSTLSRILQMGLAHQGRLVKLEIITKDEPGALNRACGIIAEAQANILQVFHSRFSQRTTLDQTLIEFELEARSKKHMDTLIEKLKENHISVTRLETF